MSYAVQWEWHKRARVEIFVVQARVRRYSPLPHCQVPPIDNIVADVQQNRVRGQTNFYLDVAKHRPEREVRGPLCPGCDALFVKAWQHPDFELYAVNKRALSSVSAQLSASERCERETPSRCGVEAALVGSGGARSAP
eukprot:4851688-Amphidinium_carterae.1